MFGLTGKQLRKYIRSLPTDGSAGDINQITAAAMGQPAPVVPSAPPVLPKPPKPPKQAMATQAQAGQGVRRSKKRRSKVRASDLRIKRKDTTSAVLSPLAIGGSGTGMNLGGY